MPWFLIFFFAPESSSAPLYIIKVLGTAVVNGDLDLEVDHCPVWPARSLMPPKRATKAQK